MAFLRDFRIRADYFKVIYGSFVRDKLQILDLLFEKGERWQRTGLLDVSVYRKPTSNWVPLSRCSSHPPQVHESWPKGMLNRFYALSTSKSDAKRLSQSFLAELDQAQAQACNCTYRQRPNTNAQPFTRLVVPFNHWYHEARFPRLFRRIYDKWSHALSIEAGCARVGLAWRLGGSHFVQLLQRASTLPHTGEKWRMYVAT